MSKENKKGQPDKTDKETFNWLNDKHIEDLGLERGGKLPESLKDAGYEKPFRIRSNEQLKAILEDKDLKERIKKTIRDLKFKKSSCVFHLDMEEDLDLGLWKQTVDFQKEIFSDVTVTYISEQLLRDFRGVLEYAKKTKKHLAVYTPINQDLGYTREVAQIVADNKEVKRLKLKYGKYSSYLRHYTDALRILNKVKKPLHITFGNKKCNISGYERIASEFIGKFLGVTSFCANFREPLKTTHRGYATSTTVFYRTTLQYKDIANSEMNVGYREQRIRNVENVEQELSVYDSMESNKKLVEYIRSKPRFAGVLSNLGVFQ